MISSLSIRNFKCFREQAFDFGKLTIFCGPNGVGKSTAIQSLLIIRDLLLGRSRFKEFSASPEGIPTNILSERLVRLRRSRIIEQIPADDGSKRRAYQLTEKGEALRPLLEALRDWGLTWEKGTRAALTPIPRRRASTAQ